MQTIRWIALGASALALTACGHKDETASNSSTSMTAETSVTNMATAPAPTPGQTFANTAAASDAFEIAMSKLAADRGQSASVKKFATMMISAHTESTAKLKTAAGSASVTPDPTLSADQQSTLDTLGGLKGAEFDKAFAAAQVQAHQSTLDALKAYAASGDVAPLKSFAASTVPVVTAHLNMAKAL